MYSFVHLNFLDCEYKATLLTSLTPNPIMIVSTLIMIIISMKYYNASDLAFRCVR